MVQWGGELVGTGTYGIIMHRCVEVYCPGFYHKGERFTKILLDELYLIHDKWGLDLCLRLALTITQGAYFGKFCSPSDKAMGIAGIS